MNLHASRLVALALVLGSHVVRAAPESASPQPTFPDAQASDPGGEAAVVSRHACACGMTPWEGQ